MRENISGHWRLGCDVLVPQFCQSCQRIVITGTPGTGKSTIAPALARELALPLVEIKKVVLRAGIRERGGIVDARALKKALSRELRGVRDYVIEGHLACEIKIPADIVIVLRTDPKTLNTRLLQRGYGKRKRCENLMAEILDYCTVRVHSSYKFDPTEIDTSTRSISSCVRLLAYSIRHKKKKLDNIHYDLGDYRDMLRRLGEPI